MARIRVVLDFPKWLVEQPVTCRLIRDYDLEVNILKAKVTPREEGRLVIEVSGKKKSLDKGMDYLKDIGIRVTPLAQDINFQEDRCTHCTYCVSLCPVGAFDVDRGIMEVTFDKEKCILCEQCVKICPYKAIRIQF
ncbi:MAG: 4Fe-4S dicluster domain-containing protein [bacterium]|nr:4Fe-4S dicluster domain-containing protein [bacterium]